MSWIKKTAVGTGVLMGVTVSFLAMLPNTRHASATVLVYDAQNVAEAIKTAINTASMLTNEQKQLALQILNMKKLDGETLAAWYKNQQTQQNEVLNEEQMKIGALNSNSSVNTFWNEEMGNVDDVLNGNMTLVDFYSSSQKGLKALDKTNYDALHNAKAVQIQNDALSSTVTTALDASNAADGNLQAVQAATTIEAAHAQATMQGNAILANLAAMEAANYQRENVERATNLQLEENSKLSMSNWVQNFSQSDRTQ
jgi:type IV secretion system protein TrbJ